MPGYPIKKSLILLISSSISLLTLAQPAQLKVVFAGDIMGHDSQIASALATGEEGYDYKPCFEYLRPYLQEADLVIGNLEVTFAGEPYKGYPAFSSPDELAADLKWAGFDILVNANNHALDRGRKGLERTLDVLEEQELVQTGTFRNSEARDSYYPLVVEKKGIRIALLNYTYGTNGIRDRPPAIVNRIDRSKIEEDMKKARTAEPDFVLVTIHWGLEYQLKESPQQRELAAFLFEQGADAILGSHPHVVQAIRGQGSGSLVAYSMGNLISNQRTRYRDGGILVEMTLSKEGQEISDAAYLPVWVWKPRSKKGTRFTLVPANLDPSTGFLSNMLPEDRSRMELFLQDTRLQLKGQREVITP